MFKVFIAEKILREIIQAESRRPVNARSNLFKVLKSAMNLYVAMDTPDIEWIKQLKKEYGLVADTTRTDYIKKIPANPESVLKNPSSLFLLDIPFAEAKKIQKEYGVMCLSADNPDISPLIDVNDIHISNEREKLGKGWDTVLNSVEKLPSNALLLTDRYMFAFRKPHAGDGIANIHEILGQLLPQEFNGGEYHVTIIFDNINKDTSYTFNDIATQLNRIKQQLGRPYSIMMEVLGITPDCSIYSKLHNRLIISNYYLVEASHKLAAFNKDRGTARQLLLPMALFTESSLNGNSTPPLKAIDLTIATLGEFSKFLSRLHDHKVYYYAVNGKRMEKCIALRNRLINKLE